MIYPSTKKFIKTKRLFEQQVQNDCILNYELDVSDKAYIMRNMRLHRLYEAYKRNETFKYVVPYASKVFDDFFNKTIFPIYNRNDFVYPLMYSGIIYDKEKDDAYINSDENCELLESEYKIYFKFDDNPNKNEVAYANYTETKNATDHKLLIHFNVNVFCTDEKIRSKSNIVITEELCHLRDFLKLVENSQEYKNIFAYTKLYEFLKDYKSYKLVPPEMQKSLFSILYLISDTEYTTHLELFTPATESITDEEIEKVLDEAPKEIIIWNYNEVLINYINDKNNDCFHFNLYECGDRYIKKFLDAIQWKYVMYPDNKDMNILFGVILCCVAKRAGIVSIDKETIFDNYNIIDDCYIKHKAIHFGVNDIEYAKKVCNLFVEKYAAYRDSLIQYTKDRLFSIARMKNILARLPKKLTTESIFFNNLENDAYVQYLYNRNSVVELRRMVAEAYSEYLLKQYDVCWNDEHNPFYETQFDVSHRKEHIDENYRYRTSNYDKKRMLEEYQNYGII